MPSALHREDVTLNPPKHWPLPCCTEGEIIHYNASSMRMTWRLTKRDWVYGSTGNVLPENGYWEFVNVASHVVTPPDESCFAVRHHAAHTAWQYILHVIRPADDMRPVILCGVG